jgi:hypothetical protein
VTRRTVVRLEIAFLLAMPTWALVLGCAGLPLDPFSTVYFISYFFLITGWAFFLSGVLPNVTVDWTAVGIAVGCLLGLAFGLHLFCAWLHREISGKIAMQRVGLEVQPPPSSVWKVRTTLSVLGLVVVMFVAGISVVGGVHQLVWLRTRTISGK